MDENIMKIAILPKAVYNSNQKSPISQRNIKKSILKFTHTHEKRPPQKSKQFEAKINNAGGIIVSNIVAAKHSTVLTQNRYVCQWNQSRCSTG